MLSLWANHTQLNETYQKMGYNNYTTSAVKSVGFLKYGYTEIRAKVGSSKISSAFWWYYNDGNTWTEIDVFEESGPLNNTAQYDDDLFSHTHIFKLSGVNTNQIASMCNCTEQNNVCNQANYYKPSFDNFSSDFHIYGMNWTETELLMYLDNEQIWKIDNSCLHEKLQLNFDRETMPDWWGLPPVNELPDQPFEIDYVRTWVQN